MKAEPSVVKPRTVTKTRESASKMLAPQGVSRTKQAIRTCSPRPVAISFQSTPRRLLENSQVMPISTARPSRPNPIRDKTSIQQLPGAPPSTAQVRRGGPWRQQQLPWRISDGGGRRLPVARHHAVAACLLRLLQALVRRAQQFGGGCPVLRPTRQAGAEGQPLRVGPAARQERTFGQLPAHPVQAFPGAADRRGEQQHE